VFGLVPAQAIGCNAPAADWVRQSTECTLMQLPVEIRRQHSWHVIQSFLIPHTALTGGPVISDESAKLQSAAPGGLQPVVPDQGAGRLAASQPLSHGRAAGQARWREAVSIALELAGIGVLSAGFWLIRPWAGLIVLGAGLMVIGFASSPRFDRREGPR
jgi:hypothetical protein